MWRQRHTTTRHIPRILAQLREHRLLCHRIGIGRICIRPRSMPLRFSQQLRPPGRQCRRKLRAHDETKFHRTSRRNVHYVESRARNVARPLADNIKVLEGVPTGIAMITIGENDNTIIVVPGANGKVDKEYIDGIKEELKNYDMVVLQHEIPLETVHYTVEFCSENNIPVILNPAPAAEVPMEVVEKVTYLTPNEHEAVLIFGNELSSEELLKKYAGKLLITQGSKGVSTCLETGEILTVPARPAKVVDTTGAGDTLNGAFSVQIANGADIKTALTFANTAASLSTEKFGAQTGMPTVSEVEKELQ